MKKEICEITGSLVKIKLSTLHIRYIPVVTPWELWDADMALVGSPHLELMYIFKNYGLKWDIIETKRYWMERKHRYNIGMKKWTEKNIREHIKKRYRIFKSIKEKGYSKSKSKGDPIKVLKKPFWETRFGFAGHKLQGPEIWNGAGRCAAAYSLGIKTIPVVFVIDKYSGTGYKGKFKSKLINVKGVWK